MLPVTAKFPLPNGSILCGILRLKLKSGVYELRIDYGSGYRVYFGQIGTTIILLLCGGDKKTQAKDIEIAQKYWQDYRSRENASQ